jgi:hypothetical protein
MNNDTPNVTVLFSSELVRVEITLNVNGGYRAGEHLFPFRTESLSPAPPMVLHEGSCGRVGSCRYFCQRAASMHLLMWLFGVIEKLN